MNLSGSYERLEDFPDKDFIDFMLCYSKKSPYLKQIDQSKIMDISYINFCKTYDLIQQIVIGIFVLFQEIVQ